MRARLFVFVFALSGLAATAYAAGGDPPARIARINYSEGAVGYAPAGDDEFVDADIDRPLVAGDKLWTDKGVRAEIQAGSAVVRMDGRTQLRVLTVDDQATQFAVTQGSVYVRVRNLPEGENFELDTPNLAWRASYPGDYRIDVDPGRGVTRVTIHAGTGAVYGDKGQALPMGGGQQITFKDRTLAQVDSHDQPPDDNFDRWAQERNRRDDQSVAARYVPRDAVGYQLLDSRGEWRQDATYGVVWFPQAVPAKWAPYRDGRWEWIAPWGWTWVDGEPWAFVTTHYGRWALVDSKWAWVPGRLGIRPVYAPALVAFVGGEKGPLAIGGKPAVAWFPLAPGEAWRPGWDASPLYISSVNANMPPQPPAKYAFQSNPEAATAVPADEFGRGRLAKGHWLRVGVSTLADAQAVAPPAMPAQAMAAMVARKPQPAPQGQPVAEQGAAAVQREAEAQRQQVQAQREQQAKAEQARAAAQEKLAQQKATQQQQVAVQQKAAAQKAAVQKAAAEEEQRRDQQQQKLAQQQRAEQQQQRIAQQRAEEQRAAAQRAEQARRDTVARRTQEAKQQAIAQREQARREQARRELALARERQAQREVAATKARNQRELQARRAQESRRLALAKQEEQARRTAHAQQVELARRAAEHDAQMLAAQRAQREAALRRVTDERERAQRDAWQQRQQQAAAEQLRRDQQRYEDQQRQRAPAPQRPSRPDLRRSPSQGEPEVWQRGVPVYSPGPTS